MLLRILGLALVAGWLAGCSPSDGAGGPGGPLYVLEADPSSPLALTYGESGDVRVIARDRDGNTVSGLTITFLLEGTSKDSGLSAVTAVTDADGAAGTTVTAGYSNALFRVRASTDEADPIFRPVAVSVGGFGALVVTPSYGGDRALGSFVLTLYFESSCIDTRVVEDQAGDRAIALSPGKSDGTFELLPASSTYAVVVRAVNASGTAFARACADGITVPMDGSTPLALEALDLAYLSEGNYDGRLSIAVTDAAGTLSQAAYDGGVAAIAASASDAAFLLDAVAASLAAPDAAAFATLRPALDGTLQSALDGAARGPTEALALAETGLLAELATVELWGTLSIAPPAGTLRLAFMAEGLDFVPSGGTAVSVGLAEAGILVLTTTFSIFDPLDASASVQMRFGLSTPLLARAALRAAASRASAGAVADWLAATAGCAELGSVVASSLAATYCDAACVAAACGAAIDDLAAAMEDGVATSAKYTEIRALGTMTLSDVDGDLVIDEIGSTLSCELAYGLATLPVPGTFDATRAP